MRAFGLGLILLALPWAMRAASAQGAAACDPASACFDVSLSPATLTGDVYLDGALIVSQVNAARLTTTPGVAHLVEMRNIQDPVTPGWNDLFIYPDQSRPNQLAGAGVTRFVVFYPGKQYVKGVLDLTCDPRGRRATDVVACRPTIDGVTLADIPAGSKASFNLAAGPHAVHTDLVGDQANNWSPTARDDAATINAGRAYIQTTRLRATFTLKGLLKIAVLPKGLVADIYLNGGLLATQVAALDVFVAPGTHTVEARAVTDPNANGQYVFPDVSQTAAVAAAGTRYVNFRPVKTWLVGFLALTCQINRKAAADDARCEVSADGAAIGTVEAAQRGTFALATGAHSLSVAVVGAQGGKWDGPVSGSLNILGGRTTGYVARFNLRPVPTPAPTSATPGINHLGTQKVVIADYFLWWEPSSFDGSIAWDAPAAGPYNSDDPGTIQRQVAEAQRACLDGFAAHWYGSFEPRTTNNFNQLLAASGGTNLRHTAVVLTNIYPGATEQMIIDSINHVIANWGQHPNYLRLGGRPVIVFTNMERPWGTDAAALEAWKRIRAATDPGHNTIWMAEGLKTTYNPLFDGLYVYRIDHRDYPQSWLKQKRFADALRAVERQGNLPIGGLYFADTIAPGFDDTRAANAGSDLRSPAPPFARDRRNGGYYADTFNATANTGGDFLFVKSYNEWIEGTQIEPGTTYGDLYLNLTCQYANAYRSR
jgi:hypothetical protein